MSIGSRIRSARKSAGMSQEELGKRLDIGKSSISEWESGKRALPIDVVEQVSEILGISVPYLMGWDEESVATKSIGLSPAALDVARQYDRLSESSQKLISMIVLFESADIDVRNRLVALLVDHNNERIQRENSLEQASSELLAALTAPEDE